MKISKDKLKQIVREEFQNLTEETNYAIRYYGHGKNMPTMHYITLIQDIGKHWKANQTLVHNSINAVIKEIPNFVSDPHWEDIRSGKKKAWDMPKSFYKISKMMPKRGGDVSIWNGKYNGIVSEDYADIMAKGDIGHHINLPPDIMDFLRTLNPTKHGTPPKSIYRKYEKEGQKVNQLAIAGDMEGAGKLIISTLQKAKKDVPPYASVYQEMKKFVHEKVSPNAWKMELNVFLRELQNSTNNPDAISQKIGSSKFSKDLSSFMDDALNNSYWMKVADSDTNRFDKFPPAPSGFLPTHRVFCTEDIETREYLHYDDLRS